MEVKSDQYYLMDYTSVKSHIVFFQEVDARVYMYLVKRFLKMHSYLSNITKLIIAIKLQTQAKITQT